MRSVTIRIEKSGKYNAVLLMEDERKSPEIPEAFREDEIEKFKKKISIIKRSILEGECS